MEANQNVSLDIHAVVDVSSFVAFKGGGWPYSYSMY